MICLAKLAPDGQTRPLNWRLPEEKKKY